jgi:aromatic ring-cleaving dioxygenase
MTPFSHSDIIEGWLISTEEERGGGLDYRHYLYRCLNINVEQQLKDGNDYTDGTGFYTWRFFSAQSQDNSYQHAMRSPNQTVDEARRQMYQYVYQRIQAARMYAARARSTDDKAQIKEYIEHAIFELGQAQHPLADNTSPEHTGFQLWRGISTPVAIYHAVKHHNAETPEQYDEQTSEPYLYVKARMQFYLDETLR